MNYLSLFLFALLFSLVFYLSFKINAEKKKFEEKITLMKEVIFRLNLEQKRQNSQLILSDDLKQKITLINQTLSQNIYEINFDLIDDNYPKRTN